MLSTFIDGLSSGTEKFRLHNNGYLGIGNSVPTYRDILVNSDYHFRAGRSGAKYVAIEDDVIRFIGMVGNGMRITTNDNAAVKYGIGTGNFLVDNSTSNPNPRLNVSGSGLVIMSGSIYFNPDPYGRNISGSSTSTGSFGHLFIAKMIILVMSQQMDLSDLKEPILIMK